MFEFLLRMRKPNKARGEAAMKWAQQFSCVELEAESLRHKIQTIQRLPRYKQTTQDNANKLLQFKGHLRQIEGHAIFFSFARKWGQDMQRRKGKMGILEVIAEQRHIQRAQEIHFRWETDLFRSNWVMHPDWLNRMLSFRKLSHAIRSNLKYKAYFASDSMILRLYLFLNRLLK